MDKRIQELIDFTNTKFGLNSYYLKRHRLYRNVNIFNETVYTLSMEWFPNHETVPDDEELNPNGTASIEINLKSRKFENVIFVMGKSYAKDGITFANLNTEDIIKWVEGETGLTYGRQFLLQSEEEGELLFKECVDGINVSPSGSIEIKFDQEGKLTLFSVHGQFPTKELIKEEKYSLSLDKLEHLKKEQLRLFEFPSYEQETIYPVYAVEEIYVTNGTRSTIPFEVFVDVSSYLKIDKTIYWDKPINKPFVRKEINIIEDVSAEQAFSCESSPDTFPITMEEQEKCVLAVRDFLRQEYPDDTGDWILKTLHREKGCIHAILRAKKQNNRVFQRKLMIMIAARNLEAMNYLDNQPMLEIFDQFQTPGRVRITIEEAYEKIKDRFEIKPYYVYDFKQKQYVLCGKLDCEYGVKASNGEVIALDDL